MSKQDDSTIAGKLERLQALVQWFDSDEFKIEDGLVKFKEAEKLANEIKLELETVKNEVNIIKQKFDI